MQSMLVLFIVEPRRWSLLISPPMIYGTMAAVEITCVISDQRPYVWPL